MGNLTLAIMIAISVVFSGYSIYFELQGMEIGIGLDRAWSFCFAVLIAIWAVEDAKKQEISKHSAYGLLVLLLWPLVLLYHMPASRGIEGIIGYAGFCALYAAPFFLGLAAYVYG